MALAAYIMLICLGSLAAAGIIITPQWDTLGVTSSLSLSRLVVGYGLWLYAFVFILLILSILKPAGKAVLYKVGWWLTTCATCLYGGVLLAIVWEHHKLLEGGHIGLSNLYEVSILMLFITGVLSLWWDKSFSRGALIMALSPLFILGAAFVNWLNAIGLATPQELIPALQNNLLPWHVGANFLSYGAFAIAAVAGVMTFFSRDEDETEHSANSILPSRQAWDNLACKAITFGLPLFSIAIVLGAWWAYEAWGGYWSWDPKETWALIVWLVYMAYLHARVTHKYSITIYAWWTILGFFITLFCYIGVNMYLSGLHSYGSLTP